MKYTFLVNGQDLGKKIADSKNGDDILKSVAAILCTSNPASQAVQVAVQNGPTQPLLVALAKADTAQVMTITVHGKNPVTGKATLAKFLRKIEVARDVENWETEITAEKSQTETTDESPELDFDNLFA